MKRSSNTYRHVTHAALVMLALLLTATAAGVGAAGDPSITSAMPEERLATLRETGVPEDSEMFLAYAQARDLLVTAEVFQREGEQYIQSLTEAPRQEIAIQQRVDALQPNPEPARDMDTLDRNELRARLLTARSERAETENNLDSLNKRLAARESNAAESRDRLNAIGAQLDELPKDIHIDTASTEPSVSEALAWRDAAQYVALTAERQNLEARLSSQPVRYSLMAAQRVELELLATQLTNNIKALEAALDERMQLPVDATDIGIDPSSAVHAMALELVATSTGVRDEQVATAGLLTEARTYRDDVKAQSALLSERYAMTRRMADFAQDSEALGNVLFSHWQELDRYGSAALKLNIPQRTADTVIRRIELENELRSLTSTSSYIDARLQATGMNPGTVSSEDYAALRDIARNYRATLRTVIDTQSEYIEALSAIATNNSALRKLAVEYRNYLAGLILWIPDYRPLWQAEPGQSIARELASIRADLGAARIRSIALLAATVLLFALLRAQRPRLDAWQEQGNRLVSRPRNDSIRYTLQALLATALLSSPYPVLLFGIGASMSTGGAVDDYVLGAAAALFLLTFARQTCAADGVGTLHFGWPREMTALLHGHASWVMYFWLPLIMFLSWLLFITPWTSQAVLVRTLVLLTLIPALLVLVYRMYRGLQAHNPTSLPRSLQRFYLATGLLLLALCVAIISGYTYSVSVIVRCLNTTLWVALGLFLLHSLFMRWILITRRRLRMAELLDSQAGQGDSEDALIEEQVASVGEVSEDSRELVNVILAAAGLAALVYIWSPLLPAMAKLSEITLWSSFTQVEDETVESTITLATILVILFLAGLTVYAARKLPAMIDLLLRSQTDVSPSARYTVSSLLNYIILGSGTVAALSAIGLQWSQLQWLVAALGVGIGFGLQEIIANFISGIIILFERPIRVGDVVSIGESDGVVARIRIRATTIIDWDGKELLVPNKEFITGRLLNWSLSDTRIRVVLPVGIAYGSDVESALQILHEVVASHPRVLEDPEPSIIFNGFGDNALSLAARCFIGTMENRLGVVTELNAEIYRRFGEAGIVIAFPQRDIHFDSDKPLRVSLDVPDSGNPRAGGDQEGGA